MTILETAVQTTSAIGTLVAAIFTAKAANAAKVSAQIAADQRTYTWRFQGPYVKSELVNDSPYPAYNVTLALRANAETVHNETIPKIDAFSKHVFSIAREKRDQALEQNKDHIPTTLYVSWTTDNGLLRDFVIDRTISLGE